MESQQELSLRKFSSTGINHAGKIHQNIPKKMQESSNIISPLLPKLMIPLLNQRLSQPAQKHATKTVSSTNKQGQKIVVTFADSLLHLSQKLIVQNIQLTNPKLLNNGKRQLQKELGMIESKEQLLKYTNDVDKSIYSQLQTLNRGCSTLQE